MGSWGSGVFDNDDAQDFLGDLMDQLEEHVEDNLAEDKGYSGSIASAIRVMTILSSHCSATPPHPQIIDKWKKDWILLCKKDNSDYPNNVISELDALSSISNEVSNEQIEQVEDQVEESHPNTGEYTIGMVVRHPKYGAGTIQLIEGSGAGQRAKVDFNEHGSKWLVLSFSNLTADQ